MAAKRQPEPETEREGSFPGIGGWWQPETGWNPENERECGGLAVAVGLRARMLAFGVGGMVVG